MDSNWSNYVFDDENSDLVSPGKQLADSDHENFIERRWLSKDQETTLAIHTALENISNGHRSGRCAMCQKIDISSAYGFGHYRYKALQHSAEFGCPLCKFILEHIREIKSYCSADLTIDLNTGTLWYKYAGYQPTSFELFTHRETETKETDMALFRNIWRDPVEDGCIKLARNWLNKCCKEHSRCAQEADFISPTRLLNIRESPFLSTPTVKNSRYAILSYCWGTDVTLTTTKANLNSHREGIEFSTLPQTFKDAIVVARKLQIEFLWIDSLCIIQDEEDDWDRECLRMGDYYQNSYIMISALDSSGSNEGFLTLRPDIPSVKLFEDTSIRLRPRTLDRRKIFEGAALSKRGWTLQERLLSTRILHFSKTEMFWECKTCSARECSAREHRDPVDSRLLVYSEGDDFKRILQHIDPDKYSPSNGAFSVWYRLVKQYTRRSLSCSSDKMPAISALAASFGRITGFTYIAGLWQEDSHCLLWIDTEGKTGHKLRQSYPSWSWAAANGPIIFSFYEEERTCSTNDATIIGYHRASDSPSANDSPKASELSSTNNSSIQERFFYRQWSRATFSKESKDKVSRDTLTLKALSKIVQCVSSKNKSKDVVNGYLPEHYKSFKSTRAEFYDIGSAMCRYNVALYDEIGEVFGFGLYDDPTRDYELRESIALWIGEYIYDGRVPFKAVHFLLIVPDEMESDKWRRVGLGVSKDDPSYQGFFTTVYDNYEWKEFELV